MKRLALLVAATASLAGMGCGSGPCTRSVTVDWSGGFLGSDNQLRPCTQAGVIEVDLYINGDPNSLARVACTALGAQAVDLPGGSTMITVEGVESGGRIAYRDERTVNTVCGDLHVAAVPAEGTLALQYAFSPANVCYATQPTYIWSKVWDDVANEAAFQDTGTGPLNLCGTTLTYRLPAGSYTLLGVNEYSQSARVVGADCTHRTFTIAGASQTPVPATLVDSSQACF